MRALLGTGAHKVYTTTNTRAGDTNGAGHLALPASAVALRSLVREGVARQPQLPAYRMQVCT